MGFISCEKKPDENSVQDLGPQVSKLEFSEALQEVANKYIKSVHTVQIGDFVEHDETIKVEISPSRNAFLVYFHCKTDLSYKCKIRG